MLVSLLTSAACGPRQDDAALAGDAPPPAAALTQITSTTPVAQGLALLQQELEPVLAGDIDETDANNHLLRAEALTDRLLETRLPFQWLSGENYGLDSRLRQIQARADRVVAQIRGAAARDSVVSDVRALHQDVSDLRAAIAAGGTRAPPALEQLLADYQASRRALPPRPPAPGPAPPATPPDTTG